MGTIFGVGVVKFFLGLLVSLVRYPLPNSGSEEGQLWLRGPKFTTIISFYLLFSGLLLILVAIFTSSPR